MTVLAIWGVIASAGATIVVSILGLLMLVRYGRHRDNRGKISPPKIASVILLSGIGYTLIISIIGDFYFHMPLSTTIKDYFGEERVAWLLFALLADVFARFWALFDPD
jgi:hypothetical protein